MASKARPRAGAMKGRSPRSGDLDTVLEFAAAWKTHDLDLVMGFLAEDAIWENVPIEVLAGKAGIRRKLALAFAAARGFEWIVHEAAQAPSGAILTERLDIVLLKGRRIELRLMGIFRVVDGKIALWRDYFDLKQYSSQLGVKPW